MNQKLKKTAVGMAMSVMMLSAGTASIFASEQEYGKNYVDENQDGICDHRGYNCDFTDTDEDGICDNCGVDGISRKKYGRKQGGRKRNISCSNASSGQGKFRGGCKR